MRFFPVDIEREPQVIDLTCSFQIPELLTIDILFKYVSLHEEFSISENGIGEKTLTVYRSRLEVPEEVKARVEKEERIMAEYRRQELR